MAEPELTELNLYDLILERLRRLGAEELARQIERTVARGSVIPGEIETRGRRKAEKAKVVEKMSDPERLAVSLEFLVAAAEVPLMVNSVRQMLPCEAVEWRPDEPGPREEDTAIMPIPTNIDLAELKRNIDALLEAMRDLGLDHPEIV